MKLRKSCLCKNVCFKSNKGYRVLGTLTVYEQKQVDSEETGDSTLIEEYEVSVSKQEKV